jgi:23S rRNA pseudouridine2605 synthase
MRLAKYLAHAGVASRRAAEEIIREGRVHVGREIVTDPARDVDDSSGVMVDGERIGGAERRVVFALHKPAGVVSTAKDPQGRKTVLDFVDARGARLYPVGRLDADTTGLILLTNDGDLANALTHPSFEVPKTYRAHVGGGSVSSSNLRRLREGILLEDGMTAPAKARQIKPGTVELTIHEGRKRQVRRMLDAIGHPVQRLQRIRFGPLELADLSEGHVRPLRPAEVEQLRSAAGTPSGPRDR